MQSLINRFKEFRRPKKYRERKSPMTPFAEESNAVVRKIVSRSPGITKCPSEPLPMPGEDEVSYKRHIKVLQVWFV